MNNKDYIKENKLEKKFDLYVNNKIDEAYNKLKKECTINMKPALTKSEKMLFICSTNYKITLEAIRQGRALKKEAGDKALEEQKKKIKKIVTKIDKEHEKHLSDRLLVQQIEETITNYENNKKGFFDKFFNRKTDEPESMTYEQAISLRDKFIKENGGKDLDESLKISLYGKDYNDKKWCMDSEVYSISQEEKEIQYAVLYYITGETLDYAKRLLENNFVEEHKKYHN